MTKRLPFLFYFSTAFFFVCSGRLTGKLQLQKNNKKTCCWKKSKARWRLLRERKKCCAILASGNCRKDIFFFKDFAPKEQRATVLRTGTGPLYHRLINYTVRPTRLYSSVPQPETGTPKLFLAWHQKKSKNYSRVECPTQPRRMIHASRVYTFI